MGTIIVGSGLVVINRRIPERLFYFSRKDLRTLRTKVRYIDEDISNAIILKMTKRELVHKIVLCEIGQEAFDNYNEQCKSWDGSRAFVEYGI